jgi:hypothetical protein
LARCALRFDFEERRIAIGLKRSQARFCGSESRFGPLARFIP